MKSAILSVGTELLFGQITNTNTVFLSKQLNLLGIDVMYHYTVGDNPKRLADMIRMAMKDCDLIIATGGLGPTQDDLTKEIAAEVFGEELVLHQPSLDWLQAYYKRMNRTMSENNLKQVYMPEHGVVLDNDAGTAPGFALDKDGKIMICMPGPPREMTRMFERRVKPYLEEKTNGIIYHRMLRMFGTGESAVETELLDLINGQTDPTIATYAKEGEVAVRVASKRATLEEAEAAVNEMIEKVGEKLGTYIYSCDDEELYQVVGKLLIERKLTISAAESCTGGLFAAQLIDIPGISDVFDRSLVTYSNQAKMDELGVKAETLECFGAVSSETAVEMVQGLKKASGSDICIAVTGIAGPGGGTEEKPVGLVYIAMIYKDQCICREFRERTISRAWNRNYTTLLMLDMVNWAINNKENIDKYI